MRALVTGSSGFIGRHMIMTLQNLGWSVTTWDIEKGDDAIELFSGYHKLQYDLVVHAAARGPNRTMIDGCDMCMAYNIMLDSMMFNWAVETEQKHVVYLSSCAVYPVEIQDIWHRGPLHEIDWQRPGEEFDSYGLTKSIGEVMAQKAIKAGLPVTVVRPFSGYGETQSTDFPFGAFIDRAIKREDPFFIWGSAQQVRDFVYVGDIVKIIMRLVERQEFSEPVNICTGIGTTMHRLAEMICDTVGYTPRIIVDANAALGAMYRVGDPTMMKCWYPEPMVSLQTGIERAIEWNRTS